MTGSNAVEYIYIYVKSNTGIYTRELEISSILYECLRRTRNSHIREYLSLGFLHKLSKYVY